MINLNEMKRDYIGREPRDYIVESVTVPEGLEEKVLAAMTQKRKEIEEIQKEKQEKKAAHKSVALRAAVIAAVITLMILMIPSSRQVVVSAAESAWNAFHSWVDDVFHVGMKQTKNGYTMEIIDARVSDDFLYFTTHDNLDDCLVDFSGSIDDKKGNQIPFSINNTHGGAISSETPNEKHYALLIPNLKSLIHSYNNSYVCELTVKVHQENTKTLKQKTYFQFKLKINNFDSLIHSRELYSQDIISFNNINLNFKKLVITSSEIYMLVEYDSNNAKDTSSFFEIFPALAVIGVDNNGKPCIMNNGDRFELLSGWPYTANGKNYLVLYLYEPYIYDSQAILSLNYDNIYLPKDYQIIEFRSNDKGINYYIQYDEALQNYIDGNDENNIVSPYAQEFSKIIKFE